MNILGAIARVTGLTPYIDVYREGTRVPALRRQFEEYIAAKEREISQLKEVNARQHEFVSRETKVAPILFNTLPKSGSVFIGKTLAQSIDIEYSEQPMFHGFFPTYFLIDSAAQRLRLGNIIRQEHFDASALNINLITRFVDKLVVHVRDPRQATLSWFHHFDRLQQLHPDGINYTVHQAPPGYGDLSNPERIDWHIETHLASCVNWINDWLHVAEKNKNLPILLTTYEDFLVDKQAFFQRIFDFYGIENAANDLAEPAKHIDNNFRSGQKDEWVGVLTERQKKRCAEIIGHTLADRFKWEL
ncbi:MAG: sulfotransferase domain-containing protein [Rhodospirillales bacterium]|nr:sulfotransferase domain-containing protein [Rhodospirillales bacterium]MBO6786021.1 sulfotransferase domain-containing protein [Rhodospirillales bacterium]